MNEKSLNRQDAESAKDFKEKLLATLASWRLNTFANIDIMIWVWVLVMVCVPIARWMVGDAIIPIVATFTTLLQFGAVTVILWKRWAWRRTLIAFVLVAVITYGAEALGSKTDFPFGAYDYTATLQPQVWGVPLLIPLAWWMMIVPAWGVAAAIVGDTNGRGKPRPYNESGVGAVPSTDGGDVGAVREPPDAGDHTGSPLQFNELFKSWFARRIPFILISAAAITAWDLFLDPQMVGWGFWVWENPSGYFGIPFVNFFGWMLTASIVTALVRPSNLPVKPLLVVYGIVWILQSIGLAFFWNQPGPAFFGFIAMGSMLGLALYRLNKPLPHVWGRMGGGND